MKTTYTSALKMVLVGLLTLNLFACANIPKDPIQATLEPIKATLEELRPKPNSKDAPDPLEGFNRAMFSFNQTADRWVLKPIAETYVDVTPEGLRKALSNFLSNLDDIKVVANDLLQLKLEQAGQDTGRFLLNTSVGFLGFFDPATEFGWPKHHEDFGQTLGVWGVPSGPYLVLPILGPSTLRDTAGLIVDANIDPITQVNHEGTRNVMIFSKRGITALDIRAKLLGTEKLLESSLDPYEFFKQAYFQQRAADILDQSISESSGIDDDDLFGDL
jgi:phospholipid-binding lipoprotein MlaA